MKIIEKRSIKLHKTVVLAFLFTAISLAAQTSFAIDILETRVKRLYKEAENLAEKGDYDSALQAYNKAIGYAKDKDIRQFLLNARKELQKKRRQKIGIPEVSPGEKSVSGIAPQEMAAEEKTKAEEEKANLEADIRRLKEEKTRLEEEKQGKETERPPQAERQVKLEQEQKAKEEEDAALEKESRETEAGESTYTEELRREDEADAADLEQRKTRETHDRAVYESSTYRYQVRQVLDNAYNKFKETAVKIETDEKFKRIESKLNKLTALDNQAEEFMSHGQYEKAQDIYKKILDMSKDPDLKKYIKGR